MDYIVNIATPLQPTKFEAIDIKQNFLTELASYPYTEDELKLGIACAYVFQDPANDLLIACRAAESIGYRLERVKLSILTMFYLVKL